MKPVGLVLAFAGYTLAYFGWCSLRGPGVGLVDLLIPGRDVTIPDSLGKVTPPPVPSALGGSGGALGGLG